VASAPVAPAKAFGWLLLSSFTPPLWAPPTPYHLLGGVLLYGRRYNPPLHWPTCSRLSLAETSHVVLSSLGTCYPLQPLLYSYCLFSSTFHKPFWLTTAISCSYFTSPSVSSPILITSIFVSCHLLRLECDGPLANFYKPSYHTTHHHILLHLIWPTWMPTRNAPCSYPLAYRTLGSTGDPHRRQSPPPTPLPPFFSPIGVLQRFYSAVEAHVGQFCQAKSVGARESEVRPKFQLPMFP